MLAVLALVGFSSAVTAKTPEKEADKESKYEKLFKDKDVKTVKGFMTLHKVDDKVYAEIPYSVLNKDLMLVSYVSSISDHMDAHPGVNPMVPLLINFEKSGDRIYMNRDKSIAIGDGNPNIQRNIDMSTIGAALRAFEIKAYNPDSTAVVVDMTELMTGSERLLSPIHARSEGKFMLMGVRYEHRAEGSYVQDVSAHQHNVTITSKLTYKSNINPVYTRYTTAVMDRTFVLLPEEEMPKRETDYRLPIQSVGRLKFRSDMKAAEDFYFAKRWRLEPVDQNAFDRGEGSEVKKPIVFYVDTTFTPNLKYAIVNGIGEWNKAFEKIGFKNVIQFKDYPTPEEDPAFDPENFDYNVVRFIPSLSSGSTVRTYCDPRSGEILRTTLEICYNYVVDFPYDILLNTAHANPAARTMFPDDRLLREYMKYHIMWLTGVDCFGMTYNLTSSAAFPVDSLRSATFTQKYGTTPSMLDRALFNTLAPIDSVAPLGKYVPLDTLLKREDPSSRVRLMPTGLGEYDCFVIDWLYRPFQKGEDEKAILKAMVDKTIGNPIYRYEYAKNCPDCAADDVGDDALVIAEYDLQKLEFMLDHFEEWVSDAEDPDYQMRGLIYYNLMRRYKKIMTHIAQQIYGVKTWQRMAGDPVPASEFLSKEHQMKAINMLFSHMNRPDKFYKDEVTKHFELESKNQQEVHMDYMQLLFNTAAASLFVYEDAPGDHVRHGDFINIEVEKFWAPTKEGRELTDAEIQYQDFLFRTLLASSKMMNFKVKNRYMNPEADKSLYIDFSVDDKYALIEDLQGQIDAEFDGEDDLLMASGKYGNMKKWPLLNLQSSRHLYLGALNKAYGLMKAQLTDEDNETQQHYRFLCDMYDRLLDIE